MAFYSALNSILKECNSGFSVTNSENTEISQHVGTTDFCSFSNIMSTHLGKEKEPTASIRATGCDNKLLFFYGEHTAKAFEDSRELIAWREGSINTQGALGHFFREAFGVSCLLFSLLHIFFAVASIMEMITEYRHLNKRFFWWSSCNLAFHSTAAILLLVAGIYDIWTIKNQDELAEHLQSFRTCRQE